jgi:hypothetical protein
LRLADLCPVVLCVGKEYLEQIDIQKTASTTR